MDRFNLIRALSAYFSQEEAHNIAVILSCCVRDDGIRYNDIGIVPEQKDEIILLAYEERLLLPVKSIRGSAWEDRILNFAENERYHLPRVVKLLALRAEESGLWDCDYAIREALKEAGNQDVEQTVSFLNTVIKMAKNNRMKVSEMQVLQTDLGIDLDMHDTLDHFVRCGIMSPVTQRSLHAGSPMYELNPCMNWSHR
ncbi:MAG: hypothetical protein R6U89_04600 [Dehalococcoidia bacterium]